MRILALETRFSPFFEQAVCQYDLLTRVQPLVELEMLMAKSVMTPETKQRRLAEQAARWRAIVAGLPPEARPPFSASKFALAFGDGQTYAVKLVDGVARDVRLACPGRIEHLGASREARETELKRILGIVFRAVAQQGREELAAVPANRNKPGGPSMLIERLRQLPDLLDVAVARKTLDRYAELERLKQEYDAAQKPYRFSMPYRNPGHACKSGEHHVAMIKHTLVNPARKERVELWEAEWHEAEAHGAALPEAVAAFLRHLASESIPAVPPMPEKLSFRFNTVQLVKNGGTMTLTIFPVWRDAQREPPEGFEDDIRVYRLAEDDFHSFYRDIVALDPVRYAKLTDGDFETTPPDQLYTEHLHYAVDGREVVGWGRSSAQLKDSALRQPLYALEQRAHTWTREHPTAELPHFERLMLRDVQGLEGGRNVYVAADGSVTVQVVTPTETGLAEKRYEFQLSDDQRKALLKLLDQHPLAKVRIPMPPGIPDQARPEITLQRSGGRITTVAKWDDQRHPDFDAIYAYLLGLEKAAQQKKPVRDGSYDPDWWPE